MTYNGMPVIIPLLATGYLLTIYLLLMLAQRTTRSSQYVANSFTEVYTSYGSAETVSETDQVERWSLDLSGSRTTPLVYSSTGLLALARGISATAPQELALETPGEPSGFAQQNVVQQEAVVAVVSKELLPELHSATLTPSRSPTMPEASSVS